MKSYVMEMLACPVCHGDLQWKISEGQGERIETAMARCEKCNNAYPVREGIGSFFVPDSPHIDAWEQVESGLIRYLRANPELLKQLLETPLAELNPADQLFRAFWHDEEGQFATAKLEGEIAFNGLYTPDFLRCSQAQFDFIVQRLSSGNGPIVDLASGRGYLVEQMARELQRPMIVTDISPRILRRNRRYFEYRGWYEKVSLLAFDARYTPFKNGAVATMTSNVGLANIGSPGELLKELRRVVSGELLAVHHFYPEDDAAHRTALTEFKLTELMYRGVAFENFRAAGWQVEFANECAGRALPTPKGQLLENVGVDGLPVAETVLEWGVLVAQ